MGNRAVISVEGSKVGIYLHWNGGPESVTAFLRAAKQLGVRAPIEDNSYFYARFGQLIANFIGGTTSIGYGPLSELDTDNGDNGHYIIDGEFKIVNRKHTHGPWSDASIDQKRVTEICAEVMRINAPIFARE